jgi:ABC-type molybdate transport system ATPase subunit
MPPAPPAHREQAATPDMAALIACMPKCQLHVHVEGTITPKLKLELATRNDGEDGERVTLTGPSGSGRTTMLRLLMTLERPDAGTIHVDVEPLRHMQRSRARVPADGARVMGQHWSHERALPASRQLGD